MSEKYTKGPWQLSAPEDRYDTWLILCSAPHEVAHIAPRFKSGERDKEQEEANARRIVACVNACEGISTEVLESITDFGDSIASRFQFRNKVEKELLEALETISSWDAHPFGYGVEHGSNGVRDFYRALARAAILKATGEQA